MKHMNQVFIILILIFFSQVMAQESVVDQFTENSNSELAPSLAIEKIERISPSNRIFVITNSNNAFDKGDYISILSNSNLASRALVAKTTDGGLAGIKILKIYSLSQWKKLKKGSTIQIIRGDDSYYRQKKKKLTEKDNESIVKGAEDLFDKTTFLEDDLNLEEKSNRIIKQDNIVCLSYGEVESIDNDSSAQGYTQLNVSWAYQIEDNIWGEFSYGQNIIADFPNPGLETKLTNLSFKAKYIIQAPFFSYVMPYVGYQILGSESPGAGTPDINNPGLDLEAELQLVEDMKKSSVIFGITVLKRLVPGWFIRADLGSDIISLGFGLEF
ncbi:MAG: hypothetical protein HN576_16840 [Bacteriovoracaceae bacterium]|jgi:hypothetical protein|nr:hypothetical protein [Bacteriovoracaceae bacterium]